MRASAQLTAWRPVSWRIRAPSGPARKVAKSAASWGAAALAARKAPSTVRKGSAGRPVSETVGRGAAAMGRLTSATNHGPLMTKAALPSP